MPVTAPPFTLHAWAKHTGLGLNENIVVIGTTAASDNRYYTLKNSSNVVQAIERDTVSANANSATIADANWHAYTGVFTSDSSRACFVDGTTKGSNTTARAPTTPNIFYVGRTPAGTSANLIGKIAYVAIWNRALSDAEVASLALQTPLIAAPSGLVAYYILLADALDSAGTNDLFVNGSAGYDVDMPVLGGLLPAAGAVVASGKQITLSTVGTALPGVGLITTSGLTPNTATNIASPGVGTATLSGRQITANIHAGPSGAPDVGVLTVVGQIPTFKSNLIVYPSLLTADTVDESGLAPTFVYEWTSKPDTPVALRAVGLRPNLTTDNAVRIEPDVGLVTMGSLAITLDVPVGQTGLVLPTSNQPLVADGLVPDIFAELTVIPDAGFLQVMPIALEGSELILGWHDSPPAESVTWS